MKNSFKIIGYLLIILALTDFVLGTFLNIDITGYRRSPLLIGGLGSLFIYLSGLFKPKDIKELGDNVISKIASLYIDGTKYDGKIYITSEYLKFDGNSKLNSKNINIFYKDILSMEETKKLRAKGFKIKMIENIEYSILMFGFNKVSKIIIDYYEQHKSN